ncbi:hypothetical protein J8J40_28845, partial [Mycobacterium tuberculosis]|nr:hypothetical protein [Mycobacterium tuberculosis]
LNQGPLRVLAGTTPTVAFIPDDAALPSNRQGLEKMVRAGGPVFTVSPRTDLPGTRLAAAPTGSGFTETIAMAPALFRFVEHLTRLKGL